MEALMPDHGARLVFDLREMLERSPETKEPIRVWLAQNKERLADVEVIVAEADAVTKMMAAVVGLAAGVKLRIREAPDVDSAADTRA